MQDRPEPPHTTTATRARQGITPGVVRYVLLWSLVLVVIGLAAAWMFAGR